VYVKLIPYHTGRLCTSARDEQLGLAPSQDCFVNYAYRTGGCKVASSEHGSPDVRANPLGSWSLGGMVPLIRPDFRPQFYSDI